MSSYTIQQRSIHLELGAGAAVQPKFTGSKENLPPADRSRLLLDSAATLLASSADA